MAEVEQEFIDFQCPYCHKEVAFPANSAGSLQQCPWCNQDLVVPQKSNEPVREIRMNICTSRLLLRRPTENDRSDVLEIMSDDNSLLYSGWSPMDCEEVEKWLKEDTQLRGIKRGVDIYFGIELPNISKLIGLACFNYYNEEWKHAEIEVVLNCGFRQQGYGAEAVQAVLTFAFAEMNLRRVIASCDRRNADGLKALEAAGMRREGEFIESRRVKDEWVTPVHYAMLQREWQQNGKTGKSVQ